LVQKYRLPVFTAMARESATVDPIARWTINAFGTTKPHGEFSALPAVRDELRAIVRDSSNPTGLLAGRARLDEEFGRTDWLGVIRGEGDVSVVHVATHFQARAGAWERSFLLLGSGERYEVSELKVALSAKLSALDLITLSACETELSDTADGSEFEGLGALFQKMGARAVIGTLWSIQDEGSAQFMREFYAARGENRRMSKARAMQEAQVALLSGKVVSANPKIDLRHPYYWAPFVLMGNWL